MTLGVRDLDASRAFYLDGLGWQAALDVPGEIVMIQAGPMLVLSLWAEQQFEAEVGPVRRGSGLAPFTLAHNVATREAVDAALATAAAAGADPVHAAIEREWGGYTPATSATPTGFAGRPRGIPARSARRCSREHDERADRPRVVVDGGY